MTKTSMIIASLLGIALLWLPLIPGQIKIWGTTIAFIFIAIAALMK